MKNTCTYEPAYLVELATSRKQSHKFFAQSGGMVAFGCTPAIAKKRLQALCGDNKDMFATYSWGQLISDENGAVYGRGAGRFNLFADNKVREF